MSDPRPVSASDITRVDVHLLSLPTRATLGSAHDPEPATERQLVVLRLERSDGVVGWGECSALNRPSYTPEWAEDSFERLAAWIEGSAAPDPTTHPMTAAAVEMAQLDVRLRAEDISLATHVGAVAAEVVAGATIGLLSPPDAIDAVADLVADGYSRVKVKIAPGQVDAVPHELSHHFDRLEVQVDGNGSLDERHLMDLASLPDYGVTAIEQPFPTDRPDLAAEFMTVCDLPVMADEGVRSLDDAERLLAQRALRGVVVKPPCVGGIVAALELLGWCVSNGVDASIGGMLESGLGRHALAAVAACEGFAITGDLSPAGRWLAADPWPDLVLTDGRIAVPIEPGVAPLPDPETLQRFTVRHASSRSR